MRTRETKRLEKKLFKIESEKERKGEKQNDLRRTSDRQGDAAREIHSK